MKVIGPLSDTSISPRENELKALSTFFSKACIVGKWAPDEATNQRLSKLKRVNSHNMAKTVKLFLGRNKIQLKG